jgi:uncharacterized LabA/DUF88 family protein
MTSERTMMFIDGSNLFHSTRDFDPQLKIDLVKLREVLTENRNLIRAYYYHSIPTEGPERIEKHIAFHHLLEYNGFKTVILPLRKRGIEYVEKGVDVSLVVDMLTLGFDRAYECGILVAGDADYVRAIQEVERKGIRIEVAFYDPPLCAGDLRRAAHTFASLNKLIERFRKA